MNVCNKQVHCNGKYINGVWLGYCDFCKKYFCGQLFVRDNGSKYILTKHDILSGEKLPSDERHAVRCVSVEKIKLIK